MKVVATAKVKLAEVSPVLDDTMKVYAQAVQFCVDIAWRQKIKSKAQLQQRCYYEVKERFGLQAQLVINAITQAVEMVKSAHSKPEVSKELSIRFNFPRCASIAHDWTFLSLSTIEGRVKFQITLPEVFEHYLEWKLVESTLIKDYKGRFFFCGDSPNDEPMFHYFRYTAGVKNILHFVYRMKHMPTFIASKDGGEGFAEIVETILKGRSK